jgi:hypothetical protein
VAKQKIMIKQTIALVFFSMVASLVLTTPAHAGEITATVGSYDSPVGYDYNSSFPPTTDQFIGTFSFTPVVPDTALGITISGSFGNGDSPTTALSDYYLGYSGNEEAVEIEPCDSYTADCAANENGPTNWTATLTPAEITDLAPALAAGSIDFSYTWDAMPPAEPIFDLFTGGYDPQFVYAGAATLDIAPEPATVLFCFSGLAGLAAFRRFRKS